MPPLPGPARNSRFAFGAPAVLHCGAARNRSVRPAFSASPGASCASCLILVSIPLQICSGLVHQGPVTSLWLTSNLGIDHATTYLVSNRSHFSHSFFFPLRVLQT